MGKRRVTFAWLWLEASGQPRSPRGRSARVTNRIPQTGNCWLTLRNIVIRSEARRKRNLPGALQWGG